jgi:sigma-54 specific flagellar transcriptional regulator A
MGQTNYPATIEPGAVELPAAAGGRLATAARTDIRGELVVYLPTGRSVRMEHVRRQIERVAQSATPVLVTGESGTGKEWAARYMHALSPRGDLPFVVVDCGAGSSGLLEEELFGREKGTVQDLQAARAGRIEVAEGGTLFLDNISPDDFARLEDQLQRVVRERVYQRVGGSRRRACDVRIVAAARGGDVVDGAYAGLDIFRIEMPPLRDRIDELPELVAGLGTRCAEAGLQAVEMTPGAIRVLRHYSWPGNVKELADLVERLSILYPGGQVDIADLPEHFTSSVPMRAGDRDDMAATRASGPRPQDFELPTGGMPLKSYLENIEIALIRRALHETGGVVAHAAKYLRLRRTTLAEKIKRYGIRAGDETTAI